MEKQFKNAWTKAAITKFDTHKPTLGEIPDAAADNILIAWHPVLSFLNSNLSSQEDNMLQVLDYGCGTGGFAQELHRLLRARVTGIDYANGMIDIAKKYASPDLTFVVGDHTAIAQHIRYDLITSIMALQFVPDIEQVFRTFSRSVNSGSLFIFAVFNPAWVKACLKKKVIFTDFDSADAPCIGQMRLEEDTIPVYIRSPTEYQKLAETNGFIKLMESFPEFTSDFLIHYPSTEIPTDVPEFLIMGFRKL